MGRVEMTQETIDVAAIAQAMRDAADSARSEEDLRISIEKVLDPVRLIYGLPTPRYERHHSGDRGDRALYGGGGFSDAVYGHAVIEYKRPGVLSTKRGIDEACWGRRGKDATRKGGLANYLAAEAHRQGGDHTEALRRFVGIATDGRNILFMRYRGAARITEADEPLPGSQLSLMPNVVEQRGFRISRSYPVTPESVQEFLLFLRALRRRPLTPTALAEAFGPSTNTGALVVRQLYAQLTRSTDSHVETLFAEWDRLFGIVYGQDLARANRDARILSSLYGLPGREDLKPLLFSVHTYFALLMKLLSAELASLQSGSLVSSPTRDLPQLSDAALRRAMQEMEEGGLFKRLGITNFLEADFFGWYVADWNRETAKVVRTLASTIAEFEPATGSLLPEATRDLLKRLYQYLVPRELRHDLGEYYTPDWLAELVLDELNYDGNPETRLLDPACGSGTFLVLAIRRVKEYAADHLEVEPREVIGKLLKNIVGFDLNPLAVIAARTNYLLALGNWIRHIGNIELPVYLCDSILAPGGADDGQRPLERVANVDVTTTVGTFWIPRKVVNAGRTGQVMTLVEEAIANRRTPQEFLGSVGEELADVADAGGLQTIKTLYEQVLALDEAGRNGIWGRILKNAFAPLFEGEFDLIAGNPPWVNWESLATSYRAATRQLWERYGLFSLRGHAARLGGGKKDIAMLMLYVSADRYLKKGGRLGFVVTQTLLKTHGAGDGFRRFRLGTGDYLRVTSVHDLVAVNPFEGATNRTATVAITKGDKTQFPVRYVRWRKTSRRAIPQEMMLADAKERMNSVDLAAVPVDQHQKTSPWLTSTPEAIRAVANVISPSVYRAHAGVCTWLNGVYWLEVKDRRPDGLLSVVNLHDVGSTTVRSVEALVESDLVFPLVRGRDVKRWWAHPSASILLPQDPRDRTGYAESYLKKNYRHSLAYLSEFEDQLRLRSGYRKYFTEGRDPYYTVYNVSEKTLAQHKVVWQEQSSELTAAVISGSGQPIVPDHKLMMVDCASRDEAAYLCALLNSSPARLVVKAYGIETSTSTHVLDHVGIPKYARRSPLHQRLAQLGIEAISLQSGGALDAGRLAVIEVEIDKAAGELWGLNRRQMQDIAKGLISLL